MMKEHQMREDWNKNIIFIELKILSLAVNLCDLILFEELQWKDKYVHFPNSKYSEKALEEIC